jgi:hypothetical protein
LPPNRGIDTRCCGAIACFANLRDAPRLATDS